MHSITDHTLANTLLWTEDEWELPEPFAAPDKGKKHHSKVAPQFASFNQVANDPLPNAPFSSQSLNK